jgi:hypothetical protein
MLSTGSAVCDIQAKGHAIFLHALLWEGLKPTCDLWLEPLARSFDFLGSTLRLSRGIYFTASPIMVWLQIAKSRQKRRMRSKRESDLKQTRDCYVPDFMAGATGLEPATSSVTG